MQRAGCQFVRACSAAAGSVVGRARRGAGALAAAGVIAAGAASPAHAQPGMTTPRDLRGLDAESRNGELVALDAVLMNDAGEMVKLGDYFGDGPLARTHDGRGKPAIMALVYYDCPIVCPVTMEKLRQAMNKIDYIVGEDFNIIIISIDHTNTVDMSLREKMASLLSYNRVETPAVRAGWAYHTASAGNIQRVADSVGFKFNLVEDAGEYAHAPGIILITPEGRVARYIDGLNYVNQADDIQLGLVEASQGQISATLMDRLMMWCYDYDPAKGSYTMQARRVMQIGGVVSMASIAGLVLVLRAGEKRRARKRAAAGAAAGAAATGDPPAPDGAPPAASRTASRTPRPTRPAPRPTRTRSLTQPCPPRFPARSEQP